MLDSREIRAGNWVLKITGRDTNAQSFFEYKAVALDEYYYTFAKVCFPINITPAILGNSGFKHDFGDWYINRPAEGIDEGMPFLRFKQKDKCWYLERVKLWAQPAYLHQLQNLYYALSNRELNIQLGRFENTNMIGKINFFVPPQKKSPSLKDLL